MKCGRIAKRCNESNNLVEPTFALKSFCPSFLPLLQSLPYLRDREKIVFHCSETPPSILYYSFNFVLIFTKLGGVYRQYRG